jgi:hypothetical protein
MTGSFLASVRVTVNPWEQEEVASCPPIGSVSSWLLQPARKTRKMKMTQLVKTVLFAETYLNCL